MTTTREAQTTWRLLRRSFPPSLRCPCPASSIRCLRQLQSRPPSRSLCTSRLFAASAPRSSVRHSSTYSFIPGASFGNQSSQGGNDTPPSPPSQGAPSPQPQYKVSSYELTFTCKPCGHRSTHVVSKQAYHYGTTLVRCPGCKDRHVISDHLKACILC